MKKQLFLLLMMLLPMTTWADSSGTCGDNLTWTYVEATKTLTISGSGNMWKYNYSSNKAPWYDFRDKILNVIIKEGVSSIGDYAFLRCSSLTSVTIPISVTSICKYAFDYCEGLTSVTIPNSVTSIGEGAFLHCRSLTSITIPNSVTSFGLAVFADCLSLTSVTIENGVTSIGNQAFSGCTGLTSIAIPNTVTSIGGSAFYGCSGLKSITIPNSVTDIGVSAFNGCSGLTSISIPNRVTSIGGSVFMGCSNLTSVTIPNSVTSIGNQAFSGCSGLTSVTMGNGVTIIDDQSFSMCSRLTSISIPNSVTSIGIQTFTGCGSLASISVASGNTKYDSRDNCNAIIETATNTLISGCKNTVIPNSVTNIGDWAFRYCSSLTSATIPNSVTSIGKWAFSDCSSLTSVTIQNSVTSIGTGAFGNCPNLTIVKVEMKTPANIYYDTFSNRKNATLYVPYGCKATYEAANYWKEFKEIIEVVEVTDISKMNNAIYVEPSSGRIGDDVSIKVCMKNANAATSYGFELVLPQGLSIATTSGGDFDAAVTMSTRHKGHTQTTNKLANNTYKVGVASLSGKALTDNDGLVLTIKAHVADNMAVGDYPILIQNPLIVNTDGTKPAVQSTQSKITIEDYMKGDVDGDGVVDLADAVLVINHYVGKAVSKFVEKAADVDGDGVIDLADAVRIINFYVGKVQSLAPSINIDRLDPQ